MRYNSFAPSGLFGQVHFFIMKTYNNVALSGLKYNGPFVAIIVSPFQGFLEEGMFDAL
jgi:hypothetical protein